MQSDATHYNTRHTRVHARTVSAPVVVGALSTPPARHTHCNKLQNNKKTSKMTLAHTYRAVSAQEVVGAFSTHPTRLTQCHELQHTTTHCNTLRHIATAHWHTRIESCSLSPRSRWRPFNTTCKACRMDSRIVVRFGACKEADSIVRGWCGGKVPCVLQCVAVCCSVLQCVAVCCSVLQCVAVCYTRELFDCERLVPG